MAISVCNLNMTQNKKEISVHGSKAFPVACYKDDMQKLQVPVHWHDEYEFIIATQGIVTVLLNAEQIEINTGDAIFINSGYLHGVQSVLNKKSVLHSLVILPKLISENAESVFYKNLLAPLKNKNAPNFILLNKNVEWQKNVINEMLKAWKIITEETFDFENEARYRICKALKLIVENLCENKSFLKTNANDRAINYVKKAIEFIEQNYMEEICIENLVNVCFCSESSLLRSFSQVVGTSPIQYLINFRLQKASEMLLSTDESACKIAIFCGFKDASYFSKIFKKTFGISAAKYRENFKSPNVEFLDKY